MAKIFKVGGCVRDKLLGLESKDIDFTFVCEKSSTVEEGFQEMKDWMLDRGFKIFLETPECFTIRAKFPEAWKFPTFEKFEGMVADFVMARKEVGYIPGTRRPILEIGTLEDDLLRRDFTINALAEDLNGNIIDLFNGRFHLEDKMLITPQDPKITMLDDPLRLLRALRFSITKDLDIDYKILDAVMKNPQILEKLKDVVSSERIQDELNKMFLKDTVKTLRILTDWDNDLDGKFIPILFKNDFKLKMTNKLKF